MNDERSDPAHPTAPPRPSPAPPRSAAPPPNLLPTKAAVRRYSSALAAQLLTDHGVVSGLGAWMLLAAVASDPEAEPDAIAELEGHLGCSAEDACTLLRLLVDAPHPAVASAFAAWSSSELVNDRYTRWAGGLPAATEIGPIPTPIEADQWTKARSLGLIDSFPGPIPADTAVLLATVLATRIAWIDGFDEVAASELAGPFAASASTALRAPRQHEIALFDTDAGLVAAHTARSADGLAVTSVIASENTDTGRLWEAADAVVTDRARRVSLFELPLGAGPAWTITEQVGQGPEPEVERFAATLPTWSARSKHHLTSAPGFTAAAAVMHRWLGPLAGPAPTKTVQTAVARYGAEGFEAAAVTKMETIGSAWRTPPVVRQAVRTADVRFGHRFVVVATTVTDGVGPDGRGCRVARAHWNRLPVFAALVTTPD